MNESSSSAPTLNVEQLLHLHNLTKEISSHCVKQLRGHIDAMAPLFRPRRFLGDLMEGGGREPLVGAEKNFAELADLYQSIALRPFDLRPELSTPVESVSTQMQLFAWEYTHEFQTSRGWKAIQVTSPLTWVIGYSSQYSLGMLRQVLAGKQERDPEAVRAFVLRACLMHLLFTKLPTIGELLGGLRYRVEVRRSPNFGELPFVTISAPFRTIRPSDELVNVASGLAGGSSFTEVIDLQTVQGLTDPLKNDITKILRQHGEEA
ncbi:MAG: hypothetical protein ABIZ80_05185 [Bryobacteraceae bacterium]